jgi:hypothetical protein
MFSLSFGNHSSKPLDYTSTLEDSIRSERRETAVSTLIYHMTHKQCLNALALFLIGLLLSGCAALQPPDAGGPAPAGPAYPIIWTEEPQRTEAAELAFNLIAKTSGLGNVSEGHLQPVTATIRSLPSNTGSPLYLPKVGSNAEMSEDETREALRRFINEWSVLIGSDLPQLSLIERVDRPDGTKIASYEQRAFRYPLRGDFGKLQIHFTADRKLLNLTSSCIPDADRLQSTLAGITPRLTAEGAIKHVREKGARYTDSSGNQQTFSVPASADLDARELVIYVQPPAPASQSLKIHLAWEVTVGNAPFKTVYVDAVADEVIAVR